MGPPRTRTLAAPFFWSLQTPVSSILTRPISTTRSHLLLGIGTKLAGSANGLNDALHRGLGAARINLISLISLLLAVLPQRLDHLLPERLFLNAHDALEHMSEALIGVEHRQLCAVYLRAGAAAHPRHILTHCTHA